MEIGQGCGFGIGGCEGLCPTANRTWPGYTFSLSVSIKDLSLHMTLGKSQIYCPECILGYGRRKDLLLSCRGSGSFQTDYQGFILVEVLAPH